MSSPLDTAETGVTHAQRVWRQAVVMETEIAAALVAVARAAQEYVAAEDADDIAIERLLNVVTDANLEEHRRDVQKETRRTADAKYAALREALARLGKDTAA